MVVLDKAARRATTSFISAANNAVLRVAAVFDRVHHTVWAFGVVLCVAAMLIWGDKILTASISVTLLGFSELSILRYYRMSPPPILFMTTAVVITGVALLMTAEVFLRWLLIP